MSQRSKESLLAQLEQLMNETVEVHRATCKAKEAIDREKRELETISEEGSQVIRDLKTNFENSTHQIRRHINATYHDTHREMDMLRKEWAIQLQEKQGRTSGSR